MKDVEKGKVVWWRDANDNTFYYRVRQQPYPRKYMNSYGLHENIVGGYGEMVIQTPKGSTYALDKCVVQGATNGGPTWGMLGPGQISKNIGVLFYQPGNDWREPFAYFKSAPVTSFGILDPSKA